MSAPVKTILLQAIETMLREQLPEVVTVKLDCPYPLDLATLGQDETHTEPNSGLPGLIAFEAQEDPQAGNRLMRQDLTLDIAYFAAFTSPYSDANSPAWRQFKEQADLVAGKVHGLWHDRAILAPLRALGLIKLEELRPSKAPCNEDYGEMVLPVRLTYGHALGNAFTTVIS